MNARKHLTLCVCLALLAVALLVPAGAQAAFGIKAESFHATPAESDGAPAFQAGSHPYEYTIDFTMNQDSEGSPEGILRDVIVDLPQGLVGNPLAIPRCKGAQFEGQEPKCPGDSQIGVAHVEFGGGSVHTSPVYNLTPPLGVAASIGFSVAGFNSFQEASLRSDGDYGARVSDITIPTSLDIQAVTETIWGVPADPSHDAERSCVTPGGSVFVGCASDVAPGSFLTLPTSCAGPLETTLSVGSLENPDVFESETILSENEGTPTGLSGCNALEFNPTITSQPTTNLADSPTGLDFNLHQPQAPDIPQGEPTESCSSGEWSGEPSEFAFQWLRNGTPIPGATESEYAPTGADQSTVLQCEVTATNPAAAGPGRAVSAAKTLPPAPATEPPFAYGAYLTLLAGEEEAVCESYWEGEPTITRRWFKNGTLIPGEGAERIPTRPTVGLGQGKSTHPLRTASITSTSNG